MALGDITPQVARVTSKAVVYPGHDHVVRVNIKRWQASGAGGKFVNVDVTAVTRAVLVLPYADPQVVFDSAITAGVFTFGASGNIDIDLSSFALPQSVLRSWLVLYDAEHLQGQVVIDDKDAVLEFDFRNVNSQGTTPAPGFTYVPEAPIDGETYGRQNGIWVNLEAIVSGVASVNGQTGVVVLGAADVGADPAGTGAAQAAAAVAAHEADTTPHANILNLTKVGFNVTGGGVASAAGDVVWNNTDQTLDIGLGSGVTLQAGQEVQVRGLNNSGSTMLNGQAVFISGASGNRLVFSLAQANQVTAEKTLAVLTQDILNNQQGQATVIGLVRDLNTSGFGEGNELWLSASVLGGITNVKPSAPNHAVRVGYVVRSHASIGSIFVRIQNIESVDDLHNVNIINPLDGDILEYDSATSTWVNVPNTGGAGEANTASNLGTGAGVFAQKVGVDLQFKSLVAGTNITLTPSANSVTIDAAGVGGGAVDSVNGFTGVVVLDTDDIAEGLTNLYFTNARASAAAPVQSVDGQTGAVSLSSSYAPLSHVGDTGAAHGNATTTVAGFMSGADKTKLNSVETGAQVNVGTDIAEGTRTSTTVPVTSSTGADATLSAASTTLAGVMTSADKTKLDGIATGATANQTDAFLLSRANHTGTQAISTVTGLQTALDSKISLSAVATFTGNKALALTDINTYNVSQDGTAQTVTVPAQATVAWTADAEIHIEQGAAGTVTVTGATGVTVNGVSAGSFALAAQFSVVTLKRIGSNSWTLIGSLANSIVTGPASSGDGNLVLFNGTTGKVIKDGGTVTAAGLALLDDANAAAQRTTLGVGTGDSPTFTALTLSNGQIVFPATQVPSANANTLDDYEEGTWTPTLTFATPGDLAVTYSTQSGFYTKIGRFVSIQCNVAASSFTHTTASGQFRISGLPFVPAISSSGSVGFTNGIVAGAGSLLVILVSGGTFPFYSYTGSTGTTATVTTAGVASGSAKETRVTAEYTL